MAIIRPLDGPGGDQRAEELRGEAGTDSPEPTPAVVFHVPESVWDIDAVVVVEHHRAPEGPHDAGDLGDAGGAGDVDPATRWNHPSAWQAGSPPPPLTVVRPDAPLPPAPDIGSDEPWLEAMAQAAATARSADSVDAWRAVATAADLVSEMARALELVAQATQEAAERHRAARHAARLALEAEEAAQEAARHADVASRRARELEDAVAVARRVNSAESWGQVRRLAMTAGAGNGYGMPRPSPDIA